jgi:hypothetical protein
LPKRPSLGQGVVEAVADGADRGHDPGFGEALGVADREVLHRGRCDGPARRRAWVPGMQRLLQGIEDEARLRGPRHTPADDPPGIGVDDEGDVAKPAQVAT